MSFKGKKSRRALTLAASGVLLIALSACSGSSNNYGGLTDDVYAKTGDFSITEKELWDELKWDSKDVLTTQINNVIINKYINNINNVMNSEFSKLTDSDKESLGITKEEEFTKLKTNYSERLVDYVIQDIYNFNFKNKNYKENLELLAENTKLKNEYSYVDEMYTTYRVTKVKDTDLDAIVGVADPYADTAIYLQIANDDVLKQVYYSLFARELFAVDKKTEEVKTADEEDEDEDDDKWGYYTTSNYISAFKTKYTRTYDVNAIIIKFTSEDEFNNTLRAFGIKMYNSKYYFIKDKKDNMSYQDYVEYYDEFSNSSLNAEHNVITISDEDVLEIFVQLYNYMYGGYRDFLSTGNSDYNVSNYNLNTLRTLTGKIIDEYEAHEEYYTNGIKHLVEEFGTNEFKDKDTKVIYTAEEIEKIGSALKTTVYETLTDEKPFSTSTTSANDGYYLAFRLKNLLDTSKNKTYEEFYNKDKTDYEILDYITNTEGLKADLKSYLINEDISDTVITTYLNTELEDVKVKIYNEACEIAYSTSASNYSKTIGSAKNDNVLATITYNDVTYNLNIKADSTDENSVKVPGTTTAFGVYDYLETINGASVAIDLLTKKVIKTTKAYEETNKDRDDYEKYLQLILLNFANDGFSSNGYSSTIGKYNFLNLYFHSADVDKIVDDYYRVQYASNKLLTDYNSTELSDFFKGYTDIAYDTYFSLTSTRLLVYFDGDEDNEADNVTKWSTKVVNDANSEFYGQTFEYVAKSLIYDIYKKLASSTTSHADKLTELVEEINKTAKFQYEENPILSENIWSKYRHLGLLVKTEEVSATNSSIDIDFNIKSRLYDYSRGHNDDNTKSYEYFINNTAPTAYIEMLSDASVSVDNDDIVETKDGYNLLLVTAGNSTPSAKWKESDDTVELLKDIVVKYNEKYTTINNIYNDADKLNTNQIKLYVLDYIVNNASTLSPSAISDAISTFLAPVVSRYTASETQRVILLSFIKNRTKQADTVELYDVITYTKAGYNGNDGVVKNMIEINQKIADDYLFIYNDITGTSDLYPDWWENIKAIVAKFLQKEGE